MLIALAAIKSGADSAVNTALPAIGDQAACAAFSFSRQACSSGSV